MTLLCRKSDLEYIAYQSSEFEVAPGELRIVDQDPEAPSAIGVGRIAQRSPWELALPLRAPRIRRHAVLTGRGAEDIAADWQCLSRRLLPNRGRSLRLL